MSEWISVDDKLPVVGWEVTVLITDGRHISTGYLQEADSDDEEDTDWIEDSQILKRDFNGYADVTHWMPLPKLPKIPKKNRSL